MKEAVYKLPQEFIHKLKKIYPARYNYVLSTFLAKKESTFRINYHKTDLHQLRKLLLEQRVRFREIAFPKGAFVLKSKLRDFQNTSIYREGFVYVQNLSSQLVPFVLTRVLPLSPTATNFPLP